MHTVLGREIAVETVTKFVIPTHILETAFELGRHGAHVKAVKLIRADALVRHVDMSLGAAKAIYDKVRATGIHSFEEKVM